MIFRLAGRAALTALALCATAATAQDEPATAPTEAPAAIETSANAALVAACCTVPARTTVEIEIVDRVNSRTSRNGDSFAIRLVEPLVVDGQIVIPAGVRGIGEVVHAARAGMAGRAGELILAVRYFDLEGRQIPLRTLRYYGRSQGRDNSGAVNTGNMVAAAVLPVASVLGFLVTGGEVDIPAGTRATAQTAAELVLPPVGTADDTVSQQEE